VGLSGAEAHARLEGFLAGASGAEAVRVLDFSPLPGGAIQENWRLDAVFKGGQLPGRQALVLRASPPVAVRDSHSRAEEFALLKVARAAGVAAPEPLWLCRDKAVIGREFHIMRRLDGIAAGHRLVREARYEALRIPLLRRLGAELAALHRIRPPRDDLAFLPLPEPSPALAELALYRRYLDELAAPQPVLEWARRWLEMRAPARGEVVLCHRDFRTGNYLVDDSGLVGILDWEFAGWSDPMEDIAWFCAKCWRFGARGEEREAGGMGPREPFYRAYEAASGRRIDAAAILYWEVMAHLRWAVIALQQGERHLSGEVPSLELALTPRIVPELELEILALTERAEKEDGHG
jgi:aminoglycoside phosphotransferase (APT) family kinase protein